MICQPKNVPSQWNDAICVYGLGTLIPPMPWEWSGVFKMVITSLTGEEYPSLARVALSPTSLVHGNIARLVRQHHLLQPYFRDHLHGFHSILLALTTKVSFVLITRLECVEGEHAQEEGAEVKRLGQHTQ